MRRKWKGLLLFGTIMMTMVALTGCGKEKINLNDYVEVTFSGYNTVGTAQVKPYGMPEPVEATAYIMMMNAMENNLELFGMSIADLSVDWETSTESTRTFMENVSGSFDKTTGLSTGDTIAFEWSVNEEKLKELEKELKVNFTYSDMEIKVEGLEDAKEWDAFENMEYSFEGRSSEAFVLFKAIPEVPELRYSTEVENGGFSNGDTIKVILTAPDNQDVTEYCMTYGKIPTELSTEIKVDKLDGYVSDLSKIPAEDLQKMDEEIQNKVAQNAAATWSWKLSEMEFIGNYLLFSKNNSSPYNYLYYIYKITELNESTGDTVSYFYYGKYRDIMLLADGTLSVDLSAIVFPNGKVDLWGEIIGEAFVRGNQYFVGYEDLDTLFNKQVTENSSKYTYTSTVNP